MSTQELEVEFLKQGIQPVYLSDGTGVFSVRLRSQATRLVYIVSFKEMDPPDEYVEGSVWFPLNVEKVPDQVDDLCMLLTNTQQKMLVGFDEKNKLFFGSIFFLPRFWRDDLTPILAACDELYPILATIVKRNYWHPHLVIFGLQQQPSSFASQ